VIRLVDFGAETGVGGRRSRQPIESALPPPVPAWYDAAMRTLPAIALTTLLLTAPFARADAPAGPFAKGTWALDLTGAYTAPIRFSENKFYNSTVTLSRYLADRFSLGLQLEGYCTEQDSGDNTVLAGAGLTLRYHVLESGRFSLFVDGAGSATYAEDEVPDFGTHFNWTGKAGVGATWQLDDRTFLIGGARYFHLSNANLHGRDQNPSYDGVQYWAGVMWTW
jgi:hypothetical protein